MSETSIFYLVFANPSNQRVLNLVKEEDTIKDLLKHPEKEQRIKVAHESFASIKKVSDFLIENVNQITVFHYGGHASSQSLFFTDQAANADGLAYQLAQQKSLKLVFLNGCSTRQQVDLLLELGIPAVIATTVSIDDSLATAFAEQFYKTIAANHTRLVTFIKSMKPQFLYVFWYAKV